jgi:hypothetical protein
MAETGNSKTSAPRNRGQTPHKAVTTIENVTTSIGV